MTSENLGMEIVPFTHPTYNKNLLHIHKQHRRIYIYTILDLSSAFPQVGLSVYECESNDHQLSLKNDMAMMPEGQIPVVVCCEMEGCNWNMTVANSTQGISAFLTAPENSSVVLSPHCWLLLLSLGLGLSAVEFNF